MLAGHLSERLSEMMHEMTGQPVQVEQAAHYRCDQCPRPVWREGGNLAAYDHWERHHQYNPGQPDYVIETRPVVAYEPKEQGQ